MDYNIKKLTSKIIESCISKIHKKTLNKIKCKKANAKDPILINTFRMLKIEQNIDMDELANQKITIKQLSKIAHKELSHNDILKICQELKVSYFQIDYMSCDGYCIDYFNYFNEVSFNIKQGYIRLYLSNKILLKAVNRSIK